MIYISSWRGRDHFADVLEDLDMNQKKGEEDTDACLDTYDTEVFLIRIFAMKIKEENKAIGTYFVLYDFYNQHKFSFSQSKKFER